MPSIHHQLLIVAAAETVYDALTTSEGLSDWWTPGALAAAEAGSIASFPFGNYYKKMLIEALEPEEIRWTCIQGADEWLGTTITFSLLTGNRSHQQASHPEMRDQLHQAGDFSEGTILRFRHDNWNDCTPMFAECSYTWGRFLRSLKSYCETGNGTPWPEQHR